MVRRRSHTIVTFVILLLRLVTILLLKGGRCRRLELLFFISGSHRLLKSGDDLGHFQGGDIRVGCLMLLLGAATLLLEDEAGGGYFVAHGGEHGGGVSESVGLLRGRVVTAVASLVVDFS